MHDRRAEVPDEAYLARRHGIDEGIAFAGVLKYLARDRPAVDGIDDASVGRVDKMLAVKLEVAYVGEARVVSRFLERADEAIEVAEDAALAKVGDRNGGMGACTGARLVDAHERVDPSVEELELPELVLLREAAIRLALHERLADHEVA